MNDPCDIASFDTVKYIDKDDYFVLKCKGWKDAKKYKIKYKKEEISAIKKEIQKKIAQHKEDKQKLINEYQKLFTQKVLSNNPNGSSLRGKKSSDNFNRLMQKINAKSFYIGVLETTLNSLGNIPPKNIRYYDRKIEF